MFCVVCASNTKTKLVRIVLVYGKDRPLQYNCTKLWTNKALLWSTINRHHTIQINSIRLAHKLVEYAKAKITKSSNGMIRKQNLLHCGQLKTNKRNAALLFHFIFAFRSDTKTKHCLIQFSQRRNCCLPETCAEQHNNGNNFIEIHF